MKKLHLTLLASFFILFLSVPDALGANEFVVDSNVRYEIEESGRTQVSHNIILENQVSDLYATSYTLELNNIEAKNVRAFEGSKEFEVEVDNEGEKTILKVNFDDALVGKGKVRNFFITFSEDSFAIRTGEIWEISIPRLLQESTFRNYWYSQFLSHWEKRLISHQSRESQRFPKVKEYIHMTKRILRSWELRLGLAISKFFHLP